MTIELADHRTSDVTTVAISKTDFARLQFVSDKHAAGATALEINKGLESKGFPFDALASIDRLAKLGLVSTSPQDPISILNTSKTPVIGPPRFYATYEGNYALETKCVVAA